MKQSSYVPEKELFPGSDIVRKYTFKAMTVGDSYTLLAKINHQLSQIFAVTGERSAHFSRKDCFECPSPQITGA